MPKRKCECKEERYQRKIKKLKKKLKNRLKENQSAPSSSSPSRPSSPARRDPAEISFTTDLCNDSDIGDYDKDPNTESTGAEGDMLDKSIIEALGQTATTEKEYGPEIHPELVKRVEGIITQGLKQEIKDDLIKKYIIPNNTKLLDAPKLNKELEGLLNDAMKARDKRVEERQQQMGVAIAALLSATDNLIKDEVDKIKLISTMSDITRLLMDLHHQDTVTRKKLIIPHLDKNVAKTVENQKRDIFLFGEKFNEDVKAATAIKKSAGNILKQNNTNKKDNNYTPNRPNQYPKKQGNYKAPPRMNPYKQGGGSRYYQQYHQPQPHPQRYSQKPKPPPRLQPKQSVRQT